MSLYYWMWGAPNGRACPGFCPSHPKSGVRRLLSALQIIPLAAAIGACLAAAPQARADTIVQFQVENVTFGDGAALTGTFTVDETTNTITLWNLVYTGGTDGVPSVTFTNGGTQTATYSTDIGFDPELTFLTAPLGTNFSETNFVVPALLGDTTLSILVGVNPIGSSASNESAVGNVAVVVVHHHTGTVSDIDPILSGILVPVSGTNAPAPVPEPSTGLILAGGLGFFFLLTRGALRRPTRASPEAPLGA